MKKLIALILLAITASCTVTYRMPVYVIKQATEADGKGMIRYYVYDTVRNNGRNSFCFSDTAKFRINEVVKISSNGQKDLYPIKAKISESELITINLLMKYKSECFNDSCKVDVYVDPNKDIEISPGVFSTTYMIGYYTKARKHKEPTFSHFLDWLSKEYDFEKNKNR